MKKRNKSFPFLPCALSVVICLLMAGLIGWVTTAHTSTWYETLRKPVFNPPAFVFAPVWTVLYFMIGVAGGYLWQQRHTQRRLFFWFLVQLGLNFLWSFVFFLGQSLTGALIEIVLLWLTLLLTLGLAYRSYRVVFYWLVPYFLWVSFASFLTISLWVLN